MTPWSMYIMQLKDYEYLISKILRKVPNHLRDDCYQAACLGLLKAQAKKKNTPIEYFNTYVYRCMQNEVTREIARMDGHGDGLFNLDASTFLLFCEYKKRKHNGEDIEDMNLTSGRIKTFDSLISCKRVEVDTWRI